MIRVRQSLAALLCSTVWAVPLLAGSHIPEGVALAVDQTFTYRVLDEHSSVDPQVVEDVGGSEIVRDLFEGLLNQDADGTLVPGVATGFEVSDDKLTYTFTLRDDATWSNGDAVTAHDFVYGWQRAASPELASPYQWYVELMSIENAGAIISGEMPPETLGVRALDDLTFEVTLAKPLRYFPQMVTHATTFPAPRAVIEAHGRDWTKPENIVSNGAYILTEHLPNERSVRERNSMYWNDANTIIDKVVALVINDENVALTRYLAGELDRTEIPAGQYPRLEREMPEETVVFPRLCSYYYTVNLTETGNPALQDVRVRQALSLALDRDIITRNVTAAGQFPAYTFTPETTAEFSVPAVAKATMTQAERDARAKELMADAGFGPSNPLKVDLIYNTSDGHRKIAVAASQMWKQKLGVDVTLANQEWKVFLETRGNQDYEIARAGWCGDYNEASTFLDLMTSQSSYNDAKYANPEVDALMTEAKTSDDAAAIYTQVEKIIAEDVPIIPIYHYTNAYMMSPDLMNWPVNNVEQNWYSKDLYKIAE